jgi:transcriptional regulator with XRE-family HTH domain
MSGNREPAARHREIGERMRAIRAGHTQKEFAELLGITQQSLSALERGETRPSPQVLQQLNERFGIRPEDVFGMDADQEALERSLIATVRTLDPDLQQLLRELAMLLAGGSTTTREAALSALKNVRNDLVHPRPPKKK